MSSNDELAELLRQPLSKFPHGDPRGLITIAPSTPCDVCHNLDLSKLPSEYNYQGPTAKTWAESAFKVPPETPAAIIRTNSKALFNSGMRGCPTCIMMVGALNGLAPRWEEKDSHIDIFLAMNLPLILRLHPGQALIRMHMDRDGIADVFAKEVPEGIGMDLSVAVQEVPPGVSEPEKLDIEIYRNEQHSEGRTVGDAIFEGLFKHIGTAAPISLHPGSQKCLDFIKTQVETCMQHHKCSRRRHPPPLPDRVIWITSPNTPSRIQVVEPQGKQRAPYIALSYCWGQVSESTLLTTESNFERHKEGIEYERLPPLFQDVFDLARVLGFEYVWIDRLCIIQGSRTDFAQQAPKMGLVYGNATLTISAASAVSENDNVLIERDEHWDARGIRIGDEKSGKGSTQLQCRRRAYSFQDEAKGGNYGKVSTRAWIWQERLLSPRTIFFTPSSLKFECTAHSIWEGFSPSTIGISYSSQILRNDTPLTHQEWLGLVEEYTRREISRPSDRLPAIESVVRRVAKAQGWEAKWGMWLGSRLAEGLGWHSNSDGRGRVCKMNPACYAPSWSWAGVDGPVSYGDVVSRGEADEVDPLVYGVEVGELDVKMKVLNVTGLVVPGRIECRVERGVGDRDVGYEYHVLGVDAGVGRMSMTADVALKPWSGVLEGEEVSTVVRVPYGEDWPGESWEGRCLCLRLATRKCISLALVLGRSQRVSGAWERVGLLSGANGLWFHGAETRVVRLH
ncbi:heterokaryon incompatibility protein-domain-containing protein [Immersiella caudata]|uniref:Heterokaryon incompatibility protein-domain-containing protein n=1 Tax=Immersiella caudata TaxID=314043 RepID=A0AA40CE82_9PEZI|nr:heterokaryon incompatibility protein-domain-containing protein [Immersiella caudata]